MVQKIPTSTMTLPAMFMSISLEILLTSSAIRTKVSSPQLPRFTPAPDAREDQASSTSAKISIEPESSERMVSDPCISLRVTM